jgi:hypothetical protein
VEPLTLTQFIAAACEVLSYAWQLYRALQAKMNEAEITRLNAELDSAYAKLKVAGGAKDAAHDLARAHRDILNS